MYEEAIKCLYVANRKEEAKKLSNEVLNKNPDAGIYCILGELENNIEYFNKALEITNNKYTRAFRCLGRYYYINKDFNKSKEYYEKAMEINPIFPDIWFTLGIIYMSEKNFIKGINAFGRILQMDDSNSEVWGNLGVCFIQLKKFKQAIKCFEEGYLRSNKNWKILDNLIYVSIESKDINKIIFCLEQFYYIDQYQQIKISYFYYLTKIYLENLKNYNERDKIYLKEKIYNLFFKFSEVDGLKPEIWDLYALFIQENEIINNNNEGKNDKIYEKIVDVRLKEIRTLMLKNIEWEKDDKIKNILCDIIKNIRLILSKIILDNDFVSDKKMFINGIEEKINNANKKNEIK
jgi:tetratricopeptide (TPR) repeat protein